MSDATPTLSRVPAASVDALLRHARSEHELPPGRRIFVNRNLRMETVRYVGFDLDWTVAPYYRLPLEELIFELALDRLVTHAGYPPGVRQAEFRPHFPHRGLIIDKIAGTVLKMNRHRYVGRAYLGREPLDGPERARLYRRTRIDLKSDRFYWVDTLFELPEVNLFAELVDLERRKRLDLPAYDKLFVDVRTAVDAVHGEGPLKQRVSADLHRYLPRDPDLPLALARLQLGNRKLMLVTNSDWSYTDRLCSYLFDGTLPGLETWRDLFALVVVSAGKPDFFRRDRKFLRLGDDGRPQEEVEVPSWNGVYAHGSRKGLMELMECAGEAVLYVGDHIYGDIVSSKVTTWRTALVLRELEDELERQQEQAPQIRHLLAVKEELSDMGHRMDLLRDLLTLHRQADGEADGEAIEAVSARLRDLEGEHRSLRRRAAELQEAVAMRYNPTWGSVFKQGGSQSLFGSQVSHFSCLYTSRVSNFAYYGTDHYFRVLSDPMAHELGP